MSGFIRFILFIVLVLVMVLAALFVSFNDQVVGLWFGREFAPRPVGQWLILSFVTGGMLGVLLGYGLWRRLRMKRRIRKLEAQIQALEAQRDNMTYRDTLQ